MPEPAIDRKPRWALLAAVAAPGLASGLLYASILLSFAFLLPVQIAFGRSGRRAGLAAAGISVATIAIAQGIRLAGAAGLGLGELAAGVLPPAALLAALCLMNAGFWRGKSSAYKALCVAAVCALAAVPLIASMERDSAIVTYLEAQVRDFLAPLRSAAGEGYEASALVAALDPRELVANSLAVLRDSFAAIILLVVAGSWRLGNRLAGPGSRGRAETPAIDELRLPYPLLWAFLASWSLVLASALARTKGAAEAIAWNCALSLSLVYAAQGLGIVTHLLKKWNMPRSMRILLAAAALLALATPAAGIAVAAGLPLIGVTEAWIPYRTPKGVGA